MNEETTAFLADFRALCEKHRVVLDGSDEYDGGEEYCGTAWMFVGGFDEASGSYKIWIELSEGMSNT